MERFNILLRIPDATVGVWRSGKAVEGFSLKKIVFFTIYLKYLLLFALGTACPAWMTKNNPVFLPLDV